MSQYQAKVEVEFEVGGVFYFAKLALSCPAENNAFDAHEEMGRMRTYESKVPDEAHIEIDDILKLTAHNEAGELIEATQPSDEDLIDFALEQNPNIDWSES